MDKSNFLELKNQNGQNDLVGRGQWPPISIQAQSVFGANLVIVAQIWDELSRGQAKFPKLQSQNGQNDPEGQGQWSLFSIPTEIT